MLSRLGSQIASWHHVDELLNEFLEYKFDSSTQPSEFKSLDAEINNILEVIDTNLGLFQHCVASIAKFNITLQKFLLNRLKVTKIDTTMNIDVNDPAEIELLFNTTVAIFSCWLKSSVNINKQHVIAFLKKHFKI